VRSAKNIYRRRSWHSRPRTTGYRSIAGRANYEVTKTVTDDHALSVDRTVGDSPANICSWRPAAWTNTPKRTEKNLIVRSGISEAETTNSKRLRWTFCIEAIQTRSIARPLCDSRASCLLRVQSFIISYFRFRFTTANNYMLFCCLRRNVEASCHKHFVVCLPWTTNDAVHQRRVSLTFATVRHRCVYNTWRSNRWQHAMKPDTGREPRFLPTHLHSTPR